MRPQPGKSEMLDPDMLLRAYGEGLFPMTMESGELGWFCPDPRGIIPIKEFHVPRGLEKALRKGAYEIRWDTSFAEIMDGCADRESTWISEIIRNSYQFLHALGHAHSVEAWHDGELAGGLYGVALGGAFFGESMFSRRADASKVALHALVRRLDEQGFTLLDTQWVTTHLQQFGACEIRRSDYLARLREAVALERSFVPVNEAP